MVPSPKSKEIENLKRHNKEVEANNRTLTKQRDAEKKRNQQNASAAVEDQCKTVARNKNRDYSAKTVQRKV